MKNQKTRKHIGYPLLLNLQALVFGHYLSLHIAWNNSTIALHAKNECYVSVSLLNSKCPSLLALTFILLKEGSTSSRSAWRNQTLRLTRKWPWKYDSPHYPRWKILKRTSKKRNHGNTLFVSHKVWLWMPCLWLHTLSAGTLYWAPFHCWDT